MSYEIQLLNEAEKHYKRFNDKTREGVDEAFAELENDPFPRGDNKIIKLVNMDAYRYRLGEYRIVYNIDRESQTCIIRGIFPRGGAYKR